MEVSFEPPQINNISTMNKSCAIEDSSIYEECSICCESFTNKSFINECLHPFCYQCILEWTKVKAACPLCIGPITGILHNIRSQDDYDIEKVEPPRVDVLANIDNDFIFDVDDTDTESSYGGMESMDMESDYDNSVIYENDDFDDVNYDNETGNFFGQFSNNDESDQAEESEDDGEAEAEAEAEAEEEESSSDHEDEDEDEDEDDADEEATNRYFNVESDSDGEEHADDEYDCDSTDDANDVEAENDNENNYFDNSDEDDDDNDEGEEDEPEHDFYDAEQDEDSDTPEYDDMHETYDVSDDDYEEPNVEYNSTSTTDDDDDDEYYC